MSHYAVAVFADSPLDFHYLLEPYSETDKTYYTRHLVSENELRERYDKFLKQNPSWAEFGFDYYLEEMGYVREGDEICAYYNDNAKWDWYSLDGRYYMFDLKRAARKKYNDDDFDGYFRKNDYNYTKPDPDYDPESDARFWELVVEEQPLRDGESKPFHLYGKQYYIDRYGTKERFMKACKKVYPYAFVTPDGVWHAPGEVGWFAVDDSTPESLDQYHDEWDKYIKDKSVNPYVSFVDCHI